MNGTITIEQWAAGMCPRVKAQKLFPLSFFFFNTAMMTCRHKVVVFQLYNLPYLIHVSCQVFSCQCFEISSSFWSLDIILTSPTWGCVISLKPAF